MRRTKAHNKKIGLSLKGRKKSPEHRAKISLAARIRLAVPENNPNYKSDAVGYVGIHLWLRKHFKKTGNCGQCTSAKRTYWALLKGKNYERKRENFWELCAKCHVAYDDIAARGWKRKQKLLELGRQAENLITV